MCWKDNLKDRLKDLAEAGICSFKIEGRLKNISYVRNVVRAYSLALDELVAANPGKYRRVSFGRSEGGFTPDLAKTFNRGYTQLFLDGKRSGNWSSMDAPKSIGEEVGTVVSIAPMRQNYSNGKRLSEENITITLRMKNPGDRLQNGDGFSFLSKGRGEIVGFRGDVCQGNRITCINVTGLYPGAKLYRNLSNAFEKELESNLPVRTIPVSVDISVIVVPVTSTSSGTEEDWSPSLPKRLSEPTYSLKINAVSQDGRSVKLEREAGHNAAENPERMRGMFATQISKATGIYSFTLRSLEVENPDGSLPFLPTSALNAIRRDLAAALEEMPCRAIPLPVNQASSRTGNAEYPVLEPDVLSQVQDIQETTSNGPHLSYKANIANHIARKIYMSLGASRTDDAFEISHRPDAELMRTKYCIRYELGLCPVHQAGRQHGRANHTSGMVNPPIPSSRKTNLYLTNNGKRYHLAFDCANCEMVVRTYFCSIL